MRAARPAVWLLLAGSLGAEAAPGSSFMSAPAGLPGSGSATSRFLPNTYTAPVPTTGIPKDADLAFAAYQRGRYVAAFREATARIERNPADAAAMTLLGELYNQGLGVRQDAAAAARWYRLAAARGDERAMASLGLMAADGRGVPRDLVESRRWFEAASAKREPTASYNLALLLLASGSEAEIRRAADLMTVAAQAELGDAQHALGVMYASGRGVARDREEAARWFLRALKNGSLAAEVEYAIALANGDGVAKDDAFAAIVFRRAALRGNAIAQNRLARLYATGRGVSKNLVEAAAWNLVAAGQGLSDPWLDGQTGNLPEGERTRAEALASLRAGSL